MTRGIAVCFALAVIGCAAKRLPPGTPPPEYETHVPPPWPPPARDAGAPRASEIEHALPPPAPTLPIPALGEPVPEMSLDAGLHAGPDAGEAGGGPSPDGGVR
jgi:hypothetical protein